VNLVQHSGVPLKVKRLAREPQRFIWAVGIAQSRCINMQMRMCALTQEANMLIPYAGKFCSFQMVELTMLSFLYSCICCC
jgi:hypothetical protein